MPTPSFPDKNRNGYPDNFEAEEAALKEQIKLRRKQYKIKKIYGSPVVDEDTDDVMEMKKSVFAELFGVKQGGK